MLVKITRCHALDARQMETAVPCRRICDGLRSHGPGAGYRGQQHWQNANASLHVLQRFLSITRPPVNRENLPV